MYKLKDYQVWALDALAEYFKECTMTGDANVSFYRITGKTLGRNIPYNEVKELPGLPYVCIRIPTGGGKTFVACHSVGIAAKELLHTSRPVVLWLVPSNAILEQTIKALRKRHHPYRQAVEMVFGEISVLDVEESLSVKKAQLDEGGTIIVTTTQSFRVEDILGRRVYRDSGELMDHFMGISPEITDSLEKGENGNILHSLANVLKLRRPIVIVDEAHNARTPLSFETLARFNPSCIIEFTATPAQDEHASNIIYSASAAELKSAEMIKLPIKLETRSNWKELLSDAIQCRKGLEKFALIEQQQTAEYIRPIMLIQAQPHRQSRETISVEIVKKHLLDDHYIPEEQIAIATGASRELEGVDVLEKSNPIRYVITIQALREGWDCPFAYVLTSLSETRSPRAIEQLLGRVLRLPGAVWKNHDELNVAYAFATSESFAEVAKSLEDALVQSGFEKQEAKDLIVAGVSEQQKFYFDEISRFMGAIMVPVPEEPNLEILPADIRDRVSFDNGEMILSLRGEIGAKEREGLKTCFSTDEGKCRIDQALSDSVLKNLVIRTPSEKQVKFAVPVLSIRQGNILEWVEETHFLDHHWELIRWDAFLSEEEYSPKRITVQTGEIDMNEAGNVTTRFISNLQHQMIFLGNESDWSVADLVHWLDVNIDHPDISPEDSGVFLTALVISLIERRNISLNQLVLDKYKLRTAAEAKIDQHRRSMHHKAFQQLLFGDDESVMVTPENSFQYPLDPRRYVYSKPYRGRYLFRKHYYPEIGDLNSEGEEFECAQFIDQLEEIDFWVRNPARRPEHSFWLQTSTDKFYPDFVCKLNDGRFLVVEYKGSHLRWNEESKEKKALGDLWSKRSNGLCLFVMPSDKDYAAISRTIK